MSECQCPHCGEWFQLVPLKKPQIENITRLEYAEDQARPLKDRVYVVLGYDPKIDRFKATFRKKDKENE